MARKKIDLTYISNPVKRKATFKKRKNGLLKKVSEITTLCDIQGCAIIYTPDEPEPEPEIWPSDQGVQSVITRFRGVSELERSKRMLCQESFLRQKITKSQEKLEKLRNENRKKEIGLFMCQYFVGRNNLDNASIIDLNDITFLADKKLEEITKKIEMLQVQEVTLAIKNGGETMTQGEQALVTNVEAMPNLNFPNDNINVSGGNGMLTLEDVNVGSGWLNELIP